MPMYKTHAIHGEIVLKQVNTKVDINTKSFKAFCMGPDAFLVSDSKVFKIQHRKKVKEYFIFLLKYIKENKLQNNSAVMAYLYGQLDHYITDVTIHPIIYYNTENFKTNSLFSFHGILEFWIDEYIMNKYNIDKVKYSKLYLKNKDLKKLIDELYKKIYQCSNASKKYSLGITSNYLFDKLIINNGILIAPQLLKLFNIGDIVKNGDLTKVYPYLNLNHEVWYDPVSGIELRYSFDNLWEDSIINSLETIDDVNRYLYYDKPLNNYFIENNISYNTGFSCTEKEEFTYAKKIR